MTIEKPSRTTSKLMTLCCLGVGGVMQIFAGVAIVRGFDGRSIEAMIAAGVFLMWGAATSYQGVGHLDLRAILKPREAGK